MFVHVAFIVAVLALCQDKALADFKRIGNGLTCKNRKAVYTFTGKRYCDGWKGISLEECQEKCARNEVPNSKCPRQGVKCKYIHFNRDTKWCHLADSTCQPTKGAAKYTITENVDFTMVGNGMTCKNRKAYTSFTGKRYCDGWKGISLEECQEKCARNEVPNSKCPRQGVKCKYVHFNRNTNWCHLADSTCEPTKGSAKYTITKKIDNTGKNCWAPCGTKGGRCDSFCGEGNLCCRRGWTNTPDEGCGNIGCVNFHCCRKRVPKPSCKKPCPKNLAPVCGSDGKNYPNECLLKNAACDNKALKKVADGPCPEVTAPPTAPQTVPPTEAPTAPPTEETPLVIDKSDPKFITNFFTCPLRSKENFANLIKCGVKSSIQCYFKEKPESYNATCKYRQGGYYCDKGNRDDVDCCIYAACHAKK